MGIEAKYRDNKNGTYDYVSKNTKTNGTVKLDPIKVSSIGKEAALEEAIWTDIKRQNVKIALEEIENDEPFL